MMSHFVACLNDSLVISLGKKANMKKCKMITYGSCSPQSTVGQLLQGSVKYFLESLSILGEVEIVQLSSHENKLISLNILQKLSQHDISGAFDKDSIKNYVNAKLA